MFFRAPINFRQGNTYPAFAKTSPASESLQGTRSVGPAGISKLKAALLGATAVVALLVPAYSQQEVDPAWYDPWAASTKTVVQQVLPRTARQASGKKISSASLPGRKSKRQARQQAASDRNRPREVAAK